MLYKIQQNISEHSRIDGMDQETDNENLKAVWSENNVAFCPFCIVVGGYTIRYIHM